MATPVKVLIVDDSASVREAMSAILAEDPDIEVIGTASDPFVAARRMQERVPDVITLDVEMPRMDGITFLRKLMSQHPIPVVICSSLTEEGSETLMQALAAGAVEVILKPKMGTKQFLMETRVRICDAVKAAAAARLKRLPKGADGGGPPPKLNADVMVPPPVAGKAMARTTERVVCIGASTGGTESMRLVLQELPENCPGIVVVQHMPEKFTAAFAARLDSVCAIEVREAKHGDRVRPGLALIAPGGRHMQLVRSGAQYHVDVIDGPPVNRHRPSVDVLFRSTARCAGGNALGIILTGMGDDGARGLKEMRDAGAATLAQDEASCVVYGMPKEAVRLGGVERSLPLSSIPWEIARYGGE